MLSAHTYEDNLMLLKQFFNSSWMAWNRPWPSGQNSERRGTDMVFFLFKKNAPHLHDQCGHASTSTSSLFNSLSLSPVEMVNFVDKFMD